MYSDLNFSIMSIYHVTYMHVHVIAISLNNHFQRKSIPGTFLGYIKQK